MLVLAVVEALGAVVLAVVLEVEAMGVVVLEVVLEDILPSTLFRSTRRLFFVFVGAYSKGTGVDKG